MVDARLHIDADANTAAAKQGLDDLAGSVRDVGAAQGESVASTEAITAATLALSAAQAEAAESVAAMAEAAELGGARYKAAILVARDAVAQLEVAQEAVRAAGGPVSEAAIAQLAVYDGAVAAATAATEKFGLSTAQTDGLLATFARGNVGGAARGLATLATSAGGAAGAIAGVALPVLAVGVALELLPKIIAAVQSAGETLGEQWVKWTLDLNNLKTILDAHGKAIDPLSDAYQKAADGAAAVTRAQTEMGAGLIVATDNMAKNTAAAVLNDAATHHWSLTTAEAVAAMKTLGIVVPPSLEEARQAVDIFGKLYEDQLATKGPAAARAFADANKAQLEKVGGDVLKLGGTLTPEFLKMAASIGVTQAAMEKLDGAKLIKTVDDIKQHLQDLDAGLADSIDSFVKHANAVKQTAADEVAALEAKKNTDLASLQAELDALEKNHAAMGASDTDYFTKLNTITSKMQQVRSAASDQETKITDKSKAEIDDLTLKATQDAAKREQAITDESDKLTKAQAALDLYKTAMTDQAAAQKAATDQTNDMVAAFILLNNQAPKLAEQVGVLATQFRDLDAAAKAAAASVASVTAGNNSAAEDSAAGNAGS